MKKMIFLSCIILFLAPMAWAQERVENPPEYKVGDKWEWKWTKGREGRSWSNEVIEVKGNEIVSIAGRGNKLFLDKQYNLLKALNPKGEDITEGYHWERWYWFKEFPLHIGKKWQQIEKGWFYHPLKQMRFKQDYDLNYEVESFEDVVVPAGKFRAFKIKMTAVTEVETGKREAIFRVDLWYSPDTKSYVMREWEFSERLHSEWRGAVFKLMKFEPGK